METLLPGELPVIDALPARPPRPLTSLVGRDGEIERLVALARTPGCRLITLTGPGGVGKTRLAIAACEALAGFGRTGCRFIPCVDVQSAEMMPAAIGAALEIPRPPFQSWEDALGMALAEGDHLIVLDNLEHLLDAGPFLSRLLQQCVRVQLMVTSRAPLRISGEHVFRVNPLAVTDSGGESAPGEGMEPVAPAVRLLAERAKSVQPGFSINEQNVDDLRAICRRLDGLPLAIELAAPRLASMSPAEMLDRLAQRVPMLTGGMRDAPNRHQTMQQTIEWSYGLLRPDEQRLFAALALAPGGTSFEFVEFIARRLELGSSSVLDLLTPLIDHSLLEHRVSRVGGESRYHMLETVRECALPALDANGDRSACEDAYAEWLRHWVERNERAILAGMKPFAPTLQSAAVELPNIQSAIARAVRAGDAEKALGIAAPFGIFWALLDRMREGSTILTDVFRLESASRAAPALRSWGFSSLALLLGYEGRREESLRACEESFAAAALAERDDVTAFAHHARAYLAFLSGDADGADYHGRIAVDYYQRVTPDLAYQGRFALAQAAVIRRDFETALEHFNEMVRFGYQRNHTWVLATVLEQMASVERQRGNNESALDLRERALPYVQDVVEPWTLTLHLQGIAELAIERSPELAVTLLAAIDTFRREHHFAGFPRDRDSAREWLAFLSERLGPARFEAAWEAGAAMGIPEAIACAQRASSERTQPPAARFGLTEREIEVLRYVVTGASDKEIAAALGLSRKTASNHVSSILAKLEAPSRTAAAARAFRENLLDQPGK